MRLWFVGRMVELFLMVFGVRKLVDIFNENFPALQRPLEDVLPLFVGIGFALLLVRTIQKYAALWKDGDKEP